MSKKIILSDYLRDNKIVDYSEIRDVLLNNKFEVISKRSGGNNYHEFEDSDGILIFNNPSLLVKDNGKTVYAGVINGNRIGNNIRLNNLYIYISNKKKNELVKEIIEIEEDIKLLNEEKKILSEQLLYLITNGLDELDEGSFEEFKKKEVESELKNISVSA